MKKLWFILAMTVSLVVNATSVKQLVVFGDSLSDNGNLYEYMGHKVPQKPYYGGRFTNGLVWPEQLMDAYFPHHGSRHLLDYAFGGAVVTDEDDGVVFTLTREIDSYLLAHQDKADAESLFVVWIGANNYLALPDDRGQAVAEVKQGIARGLARLVDAGAKQMVIVNLPDLGKTPLAGMFDARVAMSDLAQRHNQAVHDLVSEMKKAYPDVQWIEYDVNHTLNDILEHPEQYGFINTIDACAESFDLKSSPRPVLNIARQMSVQDQSPKDCDAYLFFDPVHPSTKAHQIMADKAKAVFDRAGVRFAHQDE